MQYDRIVTHDDFDGIASAALAGYFLEIENFAFAGPNDIIHSRISTSGFDIVCDLPYPLQGGMWFDHHVANFDDLELRGFDQGEIPGLRKLAPSCARVIVDFFAEEFEIDQELEQIAAAADVIDTFGYESIEQWRTETPASRIDCAIKVREGTISDRREFLCWMCLALMDQSLEQVAATDEVAVRADRFRAEEESMLAFVGKEMGFLDEAGEIILLDFSEHTRKARIVKNLAQIHAPESLAVLEVSPLFRRRLRTNDLSFSMSLTLAGQRHYAQFDIGEIMRTLDIGSGHPGAASGVVKSGSRAEMERNRAKTLEKIKEIWEEQKGNKE
ncbi:MAG: hypothetical protein FVQ81_15895 [Candidatus Glassbacteria bacterium]|nr:hypothetical protein [Candidatus Glassbacteria bacterium]